MEGTYTQGLLLRCDNCSDAFFVYLLCFPEKPNGEKIAMKTGMGSSAALVTSLVGALVRFFLPANRFEERDDDLEIIHNLAQLSHCFVQRKVRCIATSSYMSQS